MRPTKIIATLLLIAIPSQAMAKPLAVHAVQIGNETARYDKGDVTLDLEGNRGVIQVSPLGWDHGSLTFSVAVYNDSDEPANFDIDNISVTAGAQTLAVFSREQLESKAKSRATWSTIGMIALGGLAAAAAASSRDQYRATYVTPRGVYRYRASVPSAGGQVAAAASVAAAGAGIAAVQRNLDDARAALRDQIIQRTTVDAHSFYAGRIVVEKIKGRVVPQEVRVTVRWNGEDYPFAFQVAKAGTKAPTFTALTRATRMAEPAAASTLPPATPLEPTPVATTTPTIR